MRARNATRRRALSRAGSTTLGNPRCALAAPLSPELADQIVRASAVRAGAARVNCRNLQAWPTAVIPMIPPRGLSSGFSLSRS